MENVCEHGDHEAPEGKRFCSKECEVCEHTGCDDDGLCPNLCGRRDPVDVPHCVMCNAEMPVACKECTIDAFESVRAPKSVFGQLKEKLNDLNTLHWWSNHGDIHTRASMEMPLKNAKTDLAEWLLKNKKEIEKI